MVEVRIEHGGIFGREKESHADHVRPRGDGHENIDIDAAPSTPRL